MFWWGGPGWLYGLGNAAVWAGIVVVAVLLLRRELPNMRHPHSRSPALTLLEERYARGEISREEFLERRSALMETYPTHHGPPAPPPPPGPPPSTPSDPDPPAPPPAASGPELPSDTPPPSNPEPSP